MFLCRSEYPYVFYIFNVIFGDIHRNGSSEYREERDIANVISHPDRDDLSLIKFSEPIDFNDYVRPICLATDANEIGSYNRCKILGWGKSGSKFSFSYAICNVNE